jgi:HPt (histidine-containing phosphotransfer) domain-containing protein
VDNCNRQYDGLAVAAETPYGLEIVGYSTCLMTSDDAGRAARLSAIETRFRTTLEERVKTIVAGAARVRVGTWPGATGEDLITTVHALAGSAGLFGQERIGEAAAAMEKILNGMSSAGTTTAVDIARLREAAQRLETVYRQSFAS